jgi:hypothetical protein
LEALTASLETPERATCSEREAIVPGRSVDRNRLGNCDRAVERLLEHDEDLGALDTPRDCCSMYISSQTCPSRSWKLPPYIGPSSIVGFRRFPPAAMAFAAVSSTDSRLSADSAVIASVVVAASVISIDR